MYTIAQIIVEYKIDILLLTSTLFIHTVIFHATYVALHYGNIKHYSTSL